MTVPPEKPQRDEGNPNAIKLSPADTDLIDRLVSGEPVDLSSDAARGERAQALLGLIGRWEADEPSAELTGQTISRVVTNDPVSLSSEDGQVLDALLALRRAGLSNGPMPADQRERADRVGGVMALLDRSPRKPVPRGLAERTMAAIEHDRAEQRRLSRMSSAGGILQGRSGGFSVRQLATTAAMLLMVLSVLLPMLDKGKRDAMITACGQNLAGLGGDLQSFADDHKGSIQPQPPTIFRELSGFASRELDGSKVPTARVSLFILRDQQRIDSDHLSCPSVASDHNASYYNGQNPIAGGPLRIFLKPRPIFADTNPLYRVTPTGLVRDTKIPGLTQSKNHDGTGQNVLISDGSVKWTVRPSVYQDNEEQEDNLWLLQRPAKGSDDADVFLTP